MSVISVIESNKLIIYAQKKNNLAIIHMCDASTHEAINENSAA